MRKVNDLENVDKINYYKNVAKAFEFIQRVNPNNVSNQRYKVIKMEHVVRK